MAKSGNVRLVGSCVINGAFGGFITNSGAFLSAARAPVGIYILNVDSDIKQIAPGDTFQVTTEGVASTIVALDRLGENEAGVRIRCFTEAGVDADENTQVDWYTIDRG